MRSSICATRELPAELRVERVVEPVRADAGDAAAGAEDMDSRQHHGNEDHLAEEIARVDHAMRFGGLREREGLVDDGLQLAVGDQAHHFAQLEHRRILRAGEAQLACGRTG